MRGTRMTVSIAFACAALAAACAGSSGDDADDAGRDAGADADSDSDADADSDTDSDTDSDADTDTDADADADADTDTDADTDADTDTDSDSDTDADTDTDTDTDADTHFGFPDVWDRIGVFADQIFVSDLTEAQVEFAATHFLGTQKITVPQSELLRAHNPGFLVLHYHLGIWQQNPNDAFITDGYTWGNDFDEVTTHDDWFWENGSGERVRSSADGKYLMNIANVGLTGYWKTSIAEQMTLGEYDGVFLDSASPPLLAWEAVGGDLGGDWMPGDDRFQTTGILDDFPELGGASWPEAYASFMADICGHFEANGFACLPNVGNHLTSWDPTDYFTTSTGGMVENAWMWASEADWVQVADRILEMGDGVIILQSYPDSDTDIRERLFYLGCYLLVKNRHTYITYFADDPFTWFREYEIDLGAPFESAAGDAISTLAWNGVYRRDFEHGFVLVNPTGSAVAVALGGTFSQAVPTGDGSIDAAGVPDGDLGFTNAADIALEPWSAAVFLE